ncbi:MAG: protein kinase [Actinomycetota bacterium]
MAAGMLSERYEIGDRLGSGGMSSVYKATDRILERTVAVKILAEHLSDDERFVARFRREALAVAQLIHPNIVQVYDTGVDEDRHYIVMEYVEGRSGAQLLQRKGYLDPETTVTIGSQSCAGLDYAHRRGIIHRDVKPGNLMIVGGPAEPVPSGDGGEMTIKLTDFGIARAAEQTRITQVGSVVGTAAYLAPEQVRGEEATPASDVYALGVVLYQFLTGRLPFEGSSLAELAVRQQNERPLAPRTYNDEVPETLSSAVLRALEGDTERRFLTAEQLSDGLRRGLAGEDVTLPLEQGTPTRPLLEEDAATRQLERTEQRRAPEPRAAPTPPRRARPPQPLGPAERRRPSAFVRMMRGIGALVALLLIAAAVAAGVILLTGDSTGVKLKEVGGDTVDRVADELRQLVQDNTR